MGWLVINLAKNLHLKLKYKTKVINLSAKKYVEDNTYIDLNVNSLQATNATNTTRNVKEMIWLEWRPLYIVFTVKWNWKKVDMFVTLSSANEINVSSTVYTTLLNNINDMNISYNKSRSEGKKMLYFLLIKHI